MLSLKPKVRIIIKVEMISRELTIRLEVKLKQSVQLIPTRSYKQNYAIRDRQRKQLLKYIPVLSQKKERKCKKLKRKTIRTLTTTLKTHTILTIRQ